MFRKLKHLIFVCQTKIHMPYYIMTYIGRKTNLQILLESQRIYCYHLNWKRSISFWVRGENRKKETNINVYIIVCIVLQNNFLKMLIYQIPVYPTVYYLCILNFDEWWIYNLMCIFTVAHIYILYFKSL